MEDRSRLLFWAVAALAAALMLGRLGAPLLTDPDEARLASATVEMARSGDIVIPAHEGEPRVVRAPLLHWCQAPFFHALRRGELAARLPSALATLGSMLLVAWVARRRFGDEGALWTEAIFVTLPIVVILGRVGTADALLSLHITAALGMDMAEEGETARNRAGPIGALLGLAWLAKGPVGVALPLLMILAGRTASGRNVLPERRSALAFLAGWSVVALPWSLAAVKRVTAAGALATFRTEVLERYFAGTGTGHPSWYLAAVVAVGFFPWVAPMSLALLRVLGRRRDPAARTALYAGSALLAGLLFLSIGRGKTLQNVLPLAPLAALLVTWELGQELSAPRERRAGPVLVTAAILLEMIVLGAVAAVHPMAAARIAAAVGAVALAAAVPFATWGLLRMRPRQVYAAAAAGAFAFLMASALVLHPALARDHSAGTLVEQIPETSSGPVVLVDRRLPSLTYYLDRAPERVTTGGVASRLDRPDQPTLLIASEDLPRIPMDVMARLREVGRSAKLHVFKEIGSSTGEEAR